MAKYRLTLQLSDGNDINAGEFEVPSADECVVKNQGVENQGKYLIVGADGLVTLTDEAPAAADVVGTVENNVITLSADLPDGTYTIRYDNAGNYAPIGTLTIGDGDIVVTGNLFVASTCTIGARINSSGAVVDYPEAFLTDYIYIGDCLAKGGTNQIHIRGFYLGLPSRDEQIAMGIPENDINVVDFGGKYKGVAYYTSNSDTPIKRQDTYGTAIVRDANGDEVLTLDDTQTSATRIRLWGATYPYATSTSQLANCKIHLNELID